MLYDTVCLKGRSTRIVDPDPSFRLRRLWILWRHEYDVTESRDVVDDVTSRRARVGVHIQ